MSVMAEVCDTLGRLIDPKREASVIARRRARVEHHRYYLGATCRCCGGLLRYTSSGNCVRCQRRKSMNAVVMTT